MLTLEIRFLTLRYAATSYNDRQRAEWPPHPARVYSALVAALYDDPGHSAAERRALEWLAGAGAPEVFASAATVRRQRSVYVPWNHTTVLASVDKHLQALTEAEAEAERAQGKARTMAAKALAKAQKKLESESVKSASTGRGGTPDAAASLLPQSRSKQPRTFPVAFPDSDVVHLHWPVEPDPDPELVEALDLVAARVARLGHSSSLVSMRVTKDAVDANGRHRWVPDSSGDQLLRVPLADQLLRLDQAHARHKQANPRVLPSESIVYVDADEKRSNSPVEAPGSWFSDSGWITFEVVPGRNESQRNLLDISVAQQLTRALRGTLIKAVDGDWPEVLSGHARSGPSERPHLAITALADVGHGFATGSILGVALVPPRQLDGTGRAALLSAVARAERSAREHDADNEPPSLALKLGRHGLVWLRRMVGESAKKTLMATTWTAAARRWATVTAVALDRNPGNLLSREPEEVERAVAKAEASIASACANVGLPRPRAVWIHKRSLLGGVPAQHRFMPFPDRGDAPQRVCVHAELLFDERVRGPVILGAGRYYGLGLFRPMEER